VDSYLSQTDCSDFVILLVLDPCISYEGMKLDYADNAILSDHLEDSKSSLFDYFNANYTKGIPVPPLSSPSTHDQSAPTATGSPQKSFTARYRRKEKTSVNELEEYFKLPTEDFDSCHPIHWWIGRRAQFPNLFCMACDMLSIPGELYLSLIQAACRINIQYLQVLLSPLREYSQVVATRSPSGVLVFMPTPFVRLCLSRSSCTLPVHELMLPYIDELERSSTTPSAPFHNGPQHHESPTTPLSLHPFQHPFNLLEHVRHLRALSAMPHAATPLSLQCAPFDLLERDVPQPGA
jgi:hypothetical protein